MGIHLTAIAFFFIIPAGCCQDSSEIYLFRKDIESRLQNSGSPGKYQEGASNYSFAGDHQKALQTLELGFVPKPYTATEYDSSIIRTHTFRNAKEYIVARSASEQMIIINEAHHIPAHRTFTRSLLKGLYQNGYRYLGLEAIFDEGINHRNFATTASGYYTSEPEFGNLIHEARKTGFIIFGYEAPPENMKVGRERDSIQAKNIRSFAEQHPDGKILIHCGYEHVYENEHPGWGKAMAGRIKECMGIDPLTIDQAKFSERSSAEFSHFFSRINTGTPFILADEAGMPFNNYRNTIQTDMIVFHPLTTYEDQRPKWFMEGKTRHDVLKEYYMNLDTPVQVLAYRTGEYEKDGVPADVVEFSPDAPVPLYLDAGEYTIVVRTGNYATSGSYTITIGV